jgi:hypothetical protein
MSIVNQLKTGDRLQLSQDGHHLLANRQKMLWFSKKFMGQLAHLYSKGYRMEEASIHFIVYWKDLAEDKEYKIILPSITLVKGNQSLGKRLLIS